MKQTRILVLSALLLMCGGAAFGQAEVAIGIKGGLNFANVDASSIAAAYNSRTGYHAGAYVRFKFTKIAIQPELIYSQQGTTVKINTSNFDSNFSYMNIPVILKLYLIGGLNLQAGPQFGFLTAATGPVYDAFGNLSSGNIKNQLKGSDISVGLGAGWDLPFGLNIDARYNIGVSDINNSAAASAIKNQVFQLSAGFRLFKLGK